MKSRRTSRFVPRFYLMSFTVANITFFTRPTCASNPLLLWLSRKLPRLTSSLSLRTLTWLPSTLSVSHYPIVHALHNADSARCTRCDHPTQRPCPCPPSERRKVLNFHQVAPLLSCQILFHLLYCFSAFPI